MVKKEIWAPKWYQYAIIWVKQRRVWAAILSGIAAVFASLGYGQYVAIISVIAGALGLHSYMLPRKK